MTWVVDTCVVLDVLEDDPQFGRASAKLLENLLRDGLAVSPVTMVELAAAFGGDLADQKHFLDQAGIVHHEAWTAADTEAAHAAWHAYVAARRSQQIPRRPVSQGASGTQSVGSGVQTSGSSMVPLQSSSRPLPHVSCGAQPP